MSDPLTVEWQREGYYIVTVNVRQGGFVTEGPRFKASREELIEIRDALNRFFETRAGESPGSG